MKRVCAGLTVIAALLAAAAPALAWTSMSVPGSIYAQNTWSPGAQPLTNKSGTIWSGVVQVDRNGPSSSETGFKFAADGGWANNWGADYTVWRFPSVGTLTPGGANIGLTALRDDAPQALRFTFDESTLEFTVAPQVASVRLVGAFNNYGEDAPDGTLANVSGNVWSNTFDLASGANLQLLVNGGELWGPAGDVVAAAPATVRIAGGGALQLDGFRPGAFSVVFDADALTLAVSQLSTDPFDAAGIAAEGTLSALWNERRFSPAPQDVNLVREGSLWTGDFWVESPNTAFTLHFSERDANGNRGGRYWYPPSTANVNLGASPHTNAWVVSTTASDARRGNFTALAAGFYRLALDPDTGAFSAMRRYAAADGVNLFKDPSFESGAGWSFYNATRYDARNADNEPPSVHAGNGSAALLQRQTEDGDYGSVSQWISVSNYPGCTLRVSAWFCAFNGWTAARTRIWIQWMDADGNPVGSENETVLSGIPSSWTPYSVDVEIPEGAASANVLFSYNGSDGGEGFLLIDDAEARISSSRRLDFNTWTQISSSFGAHSPDWAVSRGRTTNNLSDVNLDPGALFISKYIEGSNNNKAVELFNPTRAPVDLAGWKLRQYNNGSSTNVAEFDLSGTVATGACFLVTRPFDDPVPLSDTLATASDRQFPGLTFNGDDAIVLVDPSGNVADRVGQVRSDVTGSLLAYVMRDHTLVRSPYTARGTTNAVTADFPYSEWEILPCDDFTGLKAHARSLPPDVYLPSGLSLVLAATATLTSPHLDGGIGDVSFWYRTANSAAAGVTGSATLVVEAASDPSFSDAVELGSVVIPSDQYDFKQFAVLADLASASYFRIRSTGVTGNAFGRIDDLSVGVTLPISRYQSFHAWTNADWANFTGTYSLGGWTLSDGRTSLDGGTEGDPAALLPAGAAVTSPSLDTGAGLVFFWTSAADPEEDSYALVVEQSADGGATWKTLATFSGSGVSNWVSRTLSATASENAVIRFRSTGSGPVLLDSIRIEQPEPASRNQDFNAWPVSSGYASETFQGWSTASAMIAADSGVDGTRGFRAKAANAFVLSPPLEGGLGNLSFLARPYSSSHSPAFKVEVSRDGGNNWQTVLTNRLDGASADEWTSFEVSVDDETVTHVRIVNTMAQTLCIDSIVCGKIVPPPSMNVVAALDPAIPYPDEAFRFASFVNPLGGATQDDIVSVTAAYTFVQPGQKPEKGTAPLAWDGAAGAWYSDDFPGLPDGSRIVFSNVVAWVSNGVTLASSSGSSTVYVDALVNSGVWINEVFYAQNNTLDATDPDDWWSWDAVQGHEFVEICGPANTDLTDWRLELQFSRPREIALNGGKATYATYRFTSASTTPASALKLSDQSDGYGFFLVGDANSDWSVNVPFDTLVPANIDGTAALLENHLHDGPGGVILLKNKQGVTVDAVSYSLAVAGTTSIGSQTVSGLGSDDSLSAVGGPGWCGTNFAWDASSGVSAGALNAGQSLTNRASTSKELPYAFHAPALHVVPDKATADPFDMLDPWPPTIAGNVSFYLAYPSSYPADGVCYVNLRPAGSGGYDVHEASLAEGAQAGTNAFMRWTMDDPWTSWKRLDAVEYYFSFNPDRRNYSTAYVAAGADGSSAVYDSEEEAAEHPFSYTFPFHDQLEFFLIDVPADPDAPVAAAFFDPGEYTSPPAEDELSLEALVGNLADSAAWRKIPVGFNDIIVVTDGADEEKGTYYYIEFERPDGIPAFFRVAPAKQPAPSP